MENNIITRAAKGPKPGEDRVEKTTNIALQEFVGSEGYQSRIIHTLNEQGEILSARTIFGIRPSNFLGQGILFTEFNDEYAKRKKEREAQILPTLQEGEQIDQVALQDELITLYLRSGMEGGNPLQDIIPTAQFFVKAIRKLCTPAFKEDPTQKISFVTLRHGEKLDADEGTRKKGQLSAKGEEEARQAGREIKKMENIQGIFGVQQPHMQMMALAFFASRKKEKIKKLEDRTVNDFVRLDRGKEHEFATMARKNLRDEMPEAWKQPYKTAEITKWEISLGENSDIMVSITRNGHTEIFSLTDLEMVVKEESLENVLSTEDSFF